MVARKGAEKQDASTEVATRDINWGEITDLQTARQALIEQYGAILSSQDVFSDGAEFVRDKDRFIGMPFIVLDFKFIVDEKSKREYVNVLIMSGDGAKFRFNDGSTGVKDQLKQLHAQYGVMPVSCKFGLRRSDYEITNDAGGTENATTYYLA